VEKFRGFFPWRGKIGPDFSTVRKKVFHTVENSGGGRRGAAQEEQHAAPQRIGDRDQQRENTEEDERHLRSMTWEML
jgi:hypothetical protein